MNRVIPVSASSVHCNSCLNTAGKEELMTLSGIGESRADAIIAYREANGPFGSVEEIMNIEGIKEKMFEKIRGSIEV